MSASTISLPLDVRIYPHSESPSTICGYVPALDEVRLVYGGSESGVKAKLREAARAALADMIEAAQPENRKRSMIGCGDGTVLLVEREHGSWGYRICGAGRQGCASAWGSKDHADAVTRAREHAEQAYSGIAWEHSI